MIDVNSLIELEDNFSDVMEKDVEPFLESIEKDGSFTSFDKKTLVYKCFETDNAKANVMLIHGFSEFTDKYYEMIYILVVNGYNVYTMDLRGHGLSERSVSDPSMVDVSSFNDYIKDLEILYNLKLKHSKLENYLLGHSMGGAIAVLFTEMHPDYFKKAVYSSPMVRMRTGKYPFFVVRAVAFLAKVFGKGKSYAAGQGPFNPKSRLLNSSCKSEARYEYIMNKRRGDVIKQTWGGSYNWTYAAVKCSDYILKNRHVKKIKLPALVLAAGKDHMVKPEFIEKFALRLPNGTFKYVEEGRHEIYHGTASERKLFYTEVLNHFSSNFLI